MNTVGIGGVELMVLLLPLLAWTAGTAIFLIALYYVVRAAVAAGIRRSRADEGPRSRGD